MLRKRRNQAIGLSDARRSNRPRVQLLAVLFLSMAATVWADAQEPRVNDSLRPVLMAVSPDPAAPFTWTVRHSV
jgi:hypothetical protein